MPVQSHGVRVCEERKEGRGEKKKKKRGEKRRGWRCFFAKKKKKKKNIHIYIYIYMKKNKKKKSENSSGMPDFHCDFSLTSIIREEKHCGKEREKERERKKESCASDLI